MDGQIVYGTLRASGVRVCCGRIELVHAVDPAHLPVSGAYATLSAARASLRQHTAEHLVVAIRTKLPAGGLFEVLEGSAADRRGRRSVAVMASFPEALKVAEGRGFMGVGQCRIDLVRGPSVYATADEFLAASRNPDGIPLLSWQGLDARFFAINEPDLPGPGGRAPRVLEPDLVRDMAAA